MERGETSFLWLLVDSEASLLLWSTFSLALRSSRSHRPKSLLHGAVRLNFDLFIISFNHSICYPPSGTMTDKRAIVVAISGCSSSGKTTLARLLRDIFPSTFILHEDDFYKTDEE